MGVKIYPIGVKEKAKSMNIKLSTLKDGIVVEKEAQRWLSRESHSLTGLAWDSARRYANEIHLPLLETTQSWVNAEMWANEKYKGAAARLPQVDCLDEDQLKRDMQYWRKEIWYEEREEEPNYRYIARLRLYIRAAQAKLDAMNRFLGETRGIYNRARDINRILKQADTELNKVQYDPKTMVLDFSSVDNNWLLEMGALDPLEQLIAGRLTEESLKELSEFGFTEEQIVAVWQEMQEREVSAEDLKSMKTLGYDFFQTAQLWKRMTGEEDKHFFACLIRGGEENYLEAFDIDPNDLSGDMAVVMVDYARCLLSYGKEEAFITFNNALLRSEKQFSEVMPDGTRIPPRMNQNGSVEKYRDIYLEWMYAGTVVLLQEDTVQLAGMEAEILKIERGKKNPEEFKKLVGYEELRRKHMQEMNLCGYWMTQSIMIDRNDKEHIEDNRFQIEKLNSANINGIGGLDYDMSYFSPWNGCERKTHVDNTIITGVEIDEAWSLEAVKKLEKDKENLTLNFVVKTVEGIATLAANRISPGAALMVSTALMVKNGAAGTVGGLDRLTNNETGKMAIKGGNIAGQNLINYAIQLNELERKTDIEERKILMKWFGRGASYLMVDEEDMEKEDMEEGITFAGFYNPKALLALEQMETVGLGAMGGWEEKQIALIKKDICEDEKLKRNGELRTVCEKMIDGGYQLVDKEYKVGSVSEFGEAIRDLQRIVANSEEAGLLDDIRKSLFGYE